MISHYLHMLNVGDHSLYSTSIYLQKIINFSLCVQTIHHLLNGTGAEKKKKMYECRRHSVQCKTTTGTSIEKTTKKKLKRNLLDF